MGEDGVPAWPPPPIWMLLSSAFGRCGSGVTALNFSRLGSIAGPFQGNRVSTAQQQWRAGNADYGSQVGHDALYDPYLLCSQEADLRQPHLNFAGCPLGNADRLRRNRTAQIRAVGIESPNSQKNRETTQGGYDARHHA